MTHEWFDTGMITTCEHHQWLGLGVCPPAAEGWCDTCGRRVPLTARRMLTLPHVLCREASGTRVRPSVLSVLPSGEITYGRREEEAVVALRLSDPTPPAFAVNGSWWQEVESGEVFTVREGVWIWVTCEGAFPFYMPMVPKLRLLHTEEG